MQGNNRRGPALIEIRNSWYGSIKNITDVGDGDTVRIEGGGHVKIDGITKQGRGSAVSAQSVYDLAIDNVKAIDAIDPDIKRLIIADINNKNRKGLLEKLSSVNLPPERVAAIVELAEKAWRLVTG